MNPLPDVGLHDRAIQGKRALSCANGKSAHRLRYCLLAMAPFFVSFQVTAAEDSDVAGQTTYEQRATTHVELGPTGPSAALDRFMLIRKRTEGCAVRFTDFRREGKKKPRSSTSSGGYDTYAEYDWYFQGDGSFDFSKLNVLTGHGKLHWGPDFRLGHGIILGGPKDTSRSVDCGTFHVWWTYPMNLAFFSFVDGKGRSDPSLEFAPTRWKDIQQVDFSNAKLRWINSAIASRMKESVWISLDQLP